MALKEKKSGGGRGLLLSKRDAHGTMLLQINSALSKGLKYLLSYVGHCSPLKRLTAKDLMPCDIFFTWGAFILPFILSKAWEKLKHHGGFGRGWGREGGIKELGNHTIEDTILNSLLAACKCVWLFAW